MRPTPFQVFCGYYLGLDHDFCYHFQNLRSLAASFGTSPSELLALMDDYHLTPEVTRHVDYNIAKAHATAQEMSSTTGRSEVEAFARRCYEEFRQALGGYDESRDFENVDFDEITRGSADGDRCRGDDE